MSEQEVAKAAVTEEVAAAPKRLPDIAYTVYIGQFPQISLLAVALAEGITEGKDGRKPMKRFAMASWLFLGMGTGAVVMGLIRKALA